MFFRQVLNDASGCASYVFGCTTKGRLAVVDPHAELVDEYVGLAEGQGVPIVAVLETHLQAGEQPWLVLTGDALLVGDAGRPDLHAHGEHTVDAMARTLYRSLTERLLSLPDDLLLYPAHYSGSVCGRGLSANPVSTIGFERRNNSALQFDSEDAFAEALVKEVPPTPPQQAEIIAANRAGRALAEQG
jgi:glyoxylase-like metal-dependent hydrolase (beta-lactamase superfamily II)